MTLQDEAREWAAHYCLHDSNPATDSFHHAAATGYEAGATRALSPETVEMVAKAVWVKLYARNFPNINVERDWDVMDPDTKDYCREIAVVAITTLGMRVSE